MHCPTKSRAGGLAGQKKYVEAERLLLSGYEGVLQRAAKISAYDRVELERGGQWIVQLYRDWGRPEQVSQWNQKLQAAKISTAKF